MGDVNYLKDLPEREYLIDHESIVLTIAAFERIGDYTRSQPTAPSVGRIYRKDLHWSGPPANWWVWICSRDPDNERGVIHRPYRALILDVIDPGEIRARSSSSRNQ